jgi:hypothetical protein
LIAPTQTTLDYWLTAFGDVKVVREPEAPEGMNKGGRGRGGVIREEDTK